MSDSDNLSVESILTDDRKPAAEDSSKSSKVSKTVPQTVNSTQKKKTTTQKTRKRKGTPIESDKNIEHVLLQQVLFQQEKV